MYTEFEDQPAVLKIKAVQLELCYICNLHSSYPYTVRIPNFNIQRPTQMLTKLFSVDGI